MRNWLIKKWDWWIYHRAVKSMERMCEREPGHAYLLELSIREWRERHQITPELKRATEVFFESMNDSMMDEIRDRITNDEVVE